MLIPQSLCDMIGMKALDGHRLSYEELTLELSLMHINDLCVMFWSCLFSQLFSFTLPSLLLPLGPLALPRSPSTT
jgi:hypothetical protein